MKKTVFSIMLCSMAAVVLADQYQDLPIGFKNGIGVQVDDMAFVGLGSAGQNFYKADLNSDSFNWQATAPFIGPETSGAAAAEANGDIYVFSGSGKVDSADVSPVIFTDIYHYDTRADEWSMLQVATPKGLLGAQAVSLGQGEIAFFGGYNKNKFDKYLYDVLSTDKSEKPELWQSIVDDYMGMPPEDYDWNTQVLVFDVDDYSWRIAGETPYLPNCGAATVWNGNLLEIINGEVKPGLRTDQIKQVRFAPQGLTWKSLAPIPAPADMDVQEGLAGAFAGIHNGALIVAGGANFHGARTAAQQGNWFAHAGLPKAFNAEAYVRVGEKWQQAANLPEGLAYGTTFTTREGVLLVGGENAAREASGTVILAQWDDSQLSYTD